MIKVFCEPLREDRFDCHLRPSDIDQAIKDFGPGLTTLYLNPMFLEGKHKIKYDFPENIRVERHAGVAGWEVQGEVREDKNSIRGEPVPDKTPGDNVLNRPDKQQNKKSVKPPPPNGKEYPPVSDPSPDFDCSASLIVNSDKNSDKTTLITKHGGGRPRKAAGYSRRTLYRREKEKQGVLL